MPRFIYFCKKLNLSFVTTKETKSLQRLRPAVV